MRVLVACEESQVVCTAFRAKGHEAYSCDLKPCSGGHPEWHIRDDALSVLNGGGGICASRTRRAPTVARQVPPFCSTTATLTTRGTAS